MDRSNESKYKKGIVFCSIKVNIIKTLLQKANSANQS